MQRAHRVVPLAAAGVLAVIGGVEIVLDPAFRAAPIGPALVLGLIVAGTVVASIAPIAATAIVAALFPVSSALGLDGPTGVSVLAFFLVPGWAAYRRPPRRSWIAPVIAQFMATAGLAAGAVLHAGSAAAETTPDLAAVVWENLFFSLLAWASWFVGILARGARDRAERASRLAEALDAERESREQRILVEERQRIAREIHDAVAHSVSVMTLQVGAVRSTLAPDAPQAEMLLGIERLGRESVAELRSVVGILRHTDEVPPASPPSLERAAELADDVRSAGLDVILRETGELGSMPRAVDVSAYRVLQEALTNVMRHAPGARAEISVDRSPTRVVVAVRNGAPAAAAAAAPQSHGEGGHGLVGMRERVAMFDGRFEAGPTADGGFDVRAEFPIGDAR